MTRDCSFAAAAALVIAMLIPFGTATASASDEPAPVRVGPEIRNARDYRIGERIADISFTDVDGEAGKLSDYAGTAATVIAVHSVDCPLSKKFTPKLSRLQKEMGDSGVAVIIVNFTEGETVANVQAFRKDHDIEHVRYVLDPEGTFARELGVESTTDTFVVDASRTLRYRGCVDDQYGLGYALDAPRMEPLRQAVSAVVERRVPPIVATTAPGCALEFEGAPTPLEGKVTYHNRVSRILQQNCQRCHRPGEAGPFSLLSYTDAKKVKGMMKYVVENRIMPPWFAEGGSHEWTNPQALSDSERQDILGWIKAGCPEGDPGDAVTDLVWHEGWGIGEPDLVVQVPRTFRVPAEGVLPYQHTKVRVPIDEDKWIQAMEIRPTGPAVVHHVLVLIQYPRRHEKDLVQPDFGDGIGGYFAVMVPGQGPTVFPEGMAKYLPRGSSLIFQMHYTPIGKEMDDQTRMAFVFADREPIHEIQTKGVAEMRFMIPPGADDYKVSAVHVFDKPSTLLSFFPHMHLRGKSFRIDLTYPDGTEDMILNVPRYDFNWQLLYQLEDPIEVPTGAKLKVTGWFDNSANNPANPDPTRRVGFGEQTTDEMMIGYFDWHPTS